MLWSFYIFSSKIATHISLGMNVLHNCHLLRSPAANRQPLNSMGLKVDVTLFEEQTFKFVLLKRKGSACLLSFLPFIFLLPFLSSPLPVFLTKGFNSGVCKKLLLEKAALERAAICYQNLLWKHLSEHCVDAQCSAHELRSTT